ncbi:MAG: aspartyl protease family protein [Acidobacteriota bacterium]
MQIRPASFFFAAFLVISSAMAPLCIAQERAWQGWELWKQGRVGDALRAAGAVLADQPADNDALHVRTLALFVQGKYREALDSFGRISRQYQKRGDLGLTMLEAYYHLNKPEDALGLAKELDLKELGFYEARAGKPFKVNAERTYLLPFVADPKVPLQFWPGLAGKINGQSVGMRFDTGAPFLTMGKEKAESLGIPLFTSGPGVAGSRDVTVWNGLAERVELGDGLVFENVPVSVLPKLDWVIFGTNLLEPFLATVDYPNSRFILTPRVRPELHSAHRAMVPARQFKMPFFLWGDHYMFGQGVFGEHDGLNLFFDSGLIALTPINGKIVQAAFSASKERLIAWGFPENELTATRFFETRRPLGIPGLLQENTLVYFNANQPYDRVFGGVRIDGLVSHAWLSSYSWTIDFDAREYSFGVK